MNLIYLFGFYKEIVIFSIFEPFSSVAMIPRTGSIFRLLFSECISAAGVSAEWVSPLFLSADSSPAIFQPRLGVWGCTTITYSWFYILRRVSMTSGSYRRSLLPTLRDHPVFFPVALAFAQFLYSYSITYNEDIQFLAVLKSFSRHSQPAPIQR